MEISLNNGWRELPHLISLLDGSIGGHGTKEAIGNWPDSKGGKDFMEGLKDDGMVNVHTLLPEE